ncbi:MAG: DEAD/DEAH box helicase family protein [Candidatus Hodarchaeota archaeon]
MSKNNQVANSGKLEFRKYQVEIAEKCVNKNSLVVLPTGLGKTIIAVLTAKKTLQFFPQRSKIIVLAPTRPLINQHYDTFSNFLPIPQEKFVVLTGKVLPEKRVQLYEENQILFYTPQTLRNDLVNRRYTLEHTALIIYDEAHHASGDYAYTMIADEYEEQNPDGVTLGLTASPGASKKKIAMLCENLHIPLDNIHIRTRKDSDVKTYLKHMSIYKIGVNLTELMQEVYSAVIVVLEERLHYLSQLSFLDVQSEVLHTKVFRKDLLKLNRELVSMLQKNMDKKGLYSALSINAQALILYHILELVEQQGLDVLLYYLEKLYSDAKKKSSSKAVKILASDSRIRRVFIELKKNQDYTPEHLIHPKYYVLQKVLLDELSQNPESRILVFVKLRDSLYNIMEQLERIDIIKPVRFVGQATKSNGDKGMSQKVQIETLDQFKKGVYNVLVSTNVGEEGLDITECDLVVFYDVVASEIRLIQRKGRTARHREGKVIILYCKGTHDEIYLKIALSKLKKMNVNLKRPQEPKAIKSISKSTSISPNQGKTKNQQANLTSFIESSFQENVIEEEEDISDVKISRLLPMKFGIRQKLQKDGIEFSIVDTDLHIVLYNRVLIQVYDPNFADDDLIPEIQEFSESCELFFIIFDFVDFEEQSPGEKRKLKNRIQELTQEYNFQFIPIEDEEELYFIIKSVLESPTGRRL